MLLLLLLLAAAVIGSAGRAPWWGPLRPNQPPSRQVVVHEFPLLPIRIIFSLIFFFFCVWLLVLWEFFIANLLLCAQRERERERGCNLISFIQSIRGMRCTWPIDGLMTPSGQFQQMTVSRDIARDFFIGPTFLDKISRVSRGKPIFYSSDANTHTHTHTHGD